VSSGHGQGLGSDFRFGFREKV